MNPYIYKSQHNVFLLWVSGHRCVLSQTDGENLIREIVLEAEREADQGDSAGGVRVGHRDEPGGRALSVKVTVNCFMTLFIQP